MGGSSRDQPSGRRDHSFDWKHRAFKAGKAELRLSVTVQGDQIGRYNYWIKTPEEFSRELSKKQNIASMISRMSSDLGSSSAWFGVMIAYAVGLVKGQILWKEGLIPALVVGLFSVVPLSKGWRKARGFFVLLDRSPDMTIVVSNKVPDRPNMIFNFLRKGQTFTH